MEEISHYKNKSASELLIEGRTTVKKRKVLVLGAPGVGKSAIIMRFKDDIFLDYYDPTIQMSYKKTLRFNNENIELELIDIDGQTEYTIFSFSKFSAGIDGFILSYSIENRQSFELLKIIHSKLVGLAGRDMPKILVANKCDLLNRREISVEEGKALAKSINCPFIEVSAKSSDNINKMFHMMLIEIKKYENNVDFKGLTCKKLFEYFIRRENCLIKIFYILMIAFMVRFYFFIKRRR
jgi:small GTP-binding protein